MPENGITKVRFDLWAVLAFLALLAGLCIGYLFNAQATIQEKNQVINDRVTKLELNYGYIVQGIADLKQGQEKVVETFNNHEKSTARLKKWQEYK